MRNKLTHCPPSRCPVCRCPEATRTRSPVGPTPRALPAGRCWPATTSDPLIPADRPPPLTHAGPEPRFRAAGRLLPAHLYQGCSLVRGSTGHRV